MIALGALVCSPAVLVRADTTGPDNFSGVWQVTVTPDDDATQSGKQEFTDMVLFENGTMSASACAVMGFAPSSYTTAGNGLSFSTTLSSDTESIVWSANTGDGGLHGTVVWTKSDGSVYHYSLTGTKQAADESGSDSSSDGSSGSSSN
jgi:hypothetical protein